MRVSARISGACAARVASAEGWSDVASSSAVDEVRVDDFPGRWNPRRALPVEIDPLARVCATALESAGWWTRGGGEVVDGGLIVALEGVSLTAHAGFARELADDPAVLGPAGFLYALPSTAASVLGLLFGLRDHQATVTEGARGGVAALSHGIELLGLARLDRVLVAGLGLAQQKLAPGPRPLDNPSPGDVRVAAALCLEPAPERRADPEISRARVVEIELKERAREDRILTGTRSCDEIPEAAARLGAKPLSSLVRWLAKAEDGETVELVEAREGQAPDGIVRVTTRGS